MCTASGCSATPPFDTKDRHELTALAQATYPSGSSLEQAINRLEAQGFECSDEHHPSVQSMRPRGPNGEMPFHCTWGRSTIPVVCGESWLVVLVPNKGIVASASAGYHHACL